MKEQTLSTSGFFISLASGAVAGTSVDVALYPLDTIKTRMQSAQGFFRAGGFRGIYSGLTAAAAGSSPSGALFFSTYESVKKLLAQNSLMEQHSGIMHMTAAGIGEMSACLIRVPTDIVKQRMQAGQYSTVQAALVDIRFKEGLFGFYRGYWETLAREIPFSFIQFPLWEALKTIWSERQNAPVNPLQGAICGSAAGSIAASITTPVDVIKTRLMLGADAAGIPYRGGMDTCLRIYREEGIKRFFAGVGPRTMWISIGGFVFFGMYEKTSAILSNITL